MYKSEKHLPDGQFVVAVGAANMDISAATPTALGLHDSTPGEIHCAAGGVARNVSENLARLAVDVRLITVVGDDVFGERLRADTSRVGVNVEAMHTLPGQRTASYVALHGPQGDMAVAVNDMAIVERLTPALLEPYTALLELASGIVLDCNLTAQTLDWLTDRFKTVPIFVDGVSVVKCTRLVAMLARIHTLKVNLLEAQALSGLPGGSIDSADLCARRLHEMGARQVVISLGQDGVCWCDADGAVGLQGGTSGLTIVSATGAGDALVAGLVQAHLQGKTLPDAVQWAMACAELTLGSCAANSPALSTQALLARLAGATATQSL